MSESGIKVVHCRKDKFDLYIGRFGHGFDSSIWKNPFIIGKDGDREEVLRKYEEYIRGHKTLMRELKGLKGKTLGCWCKPMKCHGDILVKLYEEFYGN